MSITVLSRARLVIGVVAAFWVAAGYAQDEAADVEEASAVAAEEEAVAEDAGPTEAAVEESAPAAGESGPYAEILANLPFRNGVFKDPALNAISEKYPKSTAGNVIMDVIWSGYKGKWRETWKMYYNQYTKIEQALEKGETDDLTFDLFKMALSYEILDYVGDMFASKKKIKVARDPNVNNDYLKNLVVERLGPEVIALNDGADIWEGAAYKRIIAFDGIKNRQKFMNKEYKGQSRMGLIPVEKIVLSMFYPHYIKGNYPEIKAWAKKNAKRNK